MQMENIFPATNQLRTPSFCLQFIISDIWLFIENSGLTEFQDIFIIIFNVKFLY